jgi:hypothetical protein
MLDRATVQLIVQKLDLGYVSLKEAKAFVATNYRVAIAGRTKEQFIRNLSKAI